MHPSEHDSNEWYGPWWRWMIVAWVLWWGVLYAKSVVQKRGRKVQAAIARLGSQPLRGYPEWGHPCPEGAKTR
jgi:hypothetical protein